MQVVTITVDSRLRWPEASAPAEFNASAKAAATNLNPEWSEAKARGRSTWNVSQHVKSWRLEAGELSIPRGLTNKLREVAPAAGVKLKFADARLNFPRHEWPTMRVELRDYQRDAVAAVLKHEQGIVRAPTGSGKSLTLLAAAAAAQQPALVIVRDANLLAQWVSAACGFFGLKKREIGVIRGNTRTVGKYLTVALQQTMNAPSFPLDDFVSMFGFVAVDECQEAAGKVYQNILDRFPARYRIGTSAHETRRDKMDFLIYEQFGYPPIIDIPRSTLEHRGYIHPVEVRLVPTDFDAPWYAETRDFTALVSEMIADDAREVALLDLIAEIAASGETPAFIFTHRKEHARSIADSKLPALGIRCGLMLGTDAERERFEAEKEALLKGRLPFAVGTYKAFGVGHDVPNIVTGVVATPIGKNPQYFGQVRGRICRAAAGKTSAALYVLWDRAVFPDTPKLMSAWNDGRVTVRVAPGVYKPW